MVLLAESQVLLALYRFDKKIISSQYALRKVNLQILEEKMKIS